jgi:hypothetical protein
LLGAIRPAATASSAPAVAVRGADVMVMPVQFARVAADPAPSVVCGRNSNARE